VSLEVLCDREQPRPYVPSRVVEHVYTTDTTSDEQSELGPKPKIYLWKLPHEETPHTCTDPCFRDTA
jgi:hypothetical protein